MTATGAPLYIGNQTQTTPARLDNATIASGSTSTLKQGISINNLNIGVTRAGGTWTNANLIKLGEYNLGNLSISSTGTANSYALWARKRDKQLRNHFYRWLRRLPDHTKHPLAGQK